MYKSKQDYPGIILNALHILGVKDVVREYKFLTTRKFKFDLAIVNKKIAIEFDGGIFTFGRHVRGSAFAKDAEKSNLAILNGWRLLRYTTADTKKLNWQYKIAYEIKNLIEQ